MQFRYAYGHTGNKTELQYDIVSSRRLEMVKVLFCFVFKLDPTSYYMNHCLNYC